MKTDPFVQKLVDIYGSWVADSEKCASSIGRMTKELYPYDTMFSPITINSVTIKTLL